VTAQEYLQIDDVDVMFHLKQWMRDPDPLLSDLARRFIDRKLFKAMDIPVMEDRYEEFISRASEIIARAGLAPEYYLIMDRASDVPYYGYYSPRDVDRKNLIYIETESPLSSIREISEVSEVVRGMRGYRIDRVCFPAEVTREMTQLIADSFA
jgi:hypothetical protein